MDAATWTGMTSSNKIYCQVRNVTPIPTEETGDPFLYICQPNDGDLIDMLRATPEVEISVDEVESMEVDLQFEFVEWCGDLSDRNDTGNY
jgi:hypothetical protein